MPLEGHWERANTPLRRLTRRERNVAVAVLAVTVAAIAVLLLVTAGDSRPGPAPGCIRVQVAGKTGGEVIAACGAEARATCARGATYEGPQSQKIVEGCRQAGIRWNSMPAGTAGN
ncbi:MAG: hypothetical protein WBM00_04715 [Solirubrobacterales bacterium]